MTQQSRKESRLEEILLDLKYSLKLTVGIPVGLQRPVITVESARTAILELVRECVPENKYPGHIPMDDDHGCDSHYGCGCTVGGFLDCRTQTLENLEKL